MEQHNIDKRFKDSLGEMSRQPSMDAWARIQAQMEPVQVQEEKKHKGFWLYIAAAVTLLLASVATWQFAFQPQPTGTPLAATQTLPKTPEKVVAPTQPEVIAPQPEKMVAQNATENTPKTAETKTSEIVNPVPENKAIAAAKEPKKAVQEVKTVETVEPVMEAEENQMLASTKPTPKKGKLSKEPATETSKPNPSTGLVPSENAMLAKAETEKPVTGSAAGEEIFDLNGKPVIVIVKKAAPAPQALASNTPPAPAPATEKDPVKLKNIFKQARNLKNGESVNLQDLGLHASSKLAVESRNIREKFSQVLDL